LFAFEFSFCVIILKHYKNINRLTVASYALSLCSFTVFVYYLKT
jgi:hypothetical protein